MFAANAIVLIVFACSFAFAARGNQERRYWELLIVSNVVLAISFILFARQDGTPKALLLPNSLLVIGLGLRWQALKSFFGHSSSPLWFLGLSLAVFVWLFLSPWIGYGYSFGLTNIAIAFTLLAIVVMLIREREPLPSRWALVFAYGIVVLTTLPRVIQGFVLDRGMESLLPDDLLLDLNLIAASIHIAAGGAFSITLAYERNTVSLRDAALRDPLTGLYNRRGFEEVLKQERKQGPVWQDLSLVLIDLDHFKMINDEHGHVVGDEVIRQVAGIISNVFKGNKLVARVGGEEFVVMLPDRSLASAYLLGEKLRTAVEQMEVTCRNGTVKVTASIGISQGLASLLDTSELLYEVADTSLYQAKAGGRNRVVASDSFADSRSGDPRRQGGFEFSKAKGRK